jgi:hypothetical protein
VIEHDASGGQWASDQEKEILWRVTTVPASIVRRPVWCERLEQDRNFLCDILGSLNAQTWLLCNELRKLSHRMDDFPMWA